MQPWVQATWSRGEKFGAIYEYLFEIKASNFGLRYEKFGVQGVRDMYSLKVQIYIILTIVIVCTQIDNSRKCKLQKKVSRLFISTDICRLEAPSQAFSMSSTLQDLPLERLLRKPIKLFGLT